MCTYIFQMLDTVKIILFICMCLLLFLLFLENSLKLTISLTSEEDLKIFFSFSPIAFFNYLP